MLKKITLLFALLLFNAKLISAQTLSIGPMAGINVSTLTAAPNTKALLGASIGGFLNYSIDDHFGLGAKLLFTQLGSSYTYNEDINRLNYVQMPLTAIYYFGDAGNQFRPKVFIGPYVGALLRANHKSGDEVLGTDGKPYYNKTDIGGLVGAGFNYRIKSRTWLNVDAGLGKSFTDVSKASLGYHNLAFSLNVGVSFPVGND
ncbi:porin family protein [Emticicia sp. SJ17W-69]|uniref:porin family protein n=1 Tax=Emticicia sp. SJ17W-69 TaxID=3421657 RepID=UPI003EBFFEF4